MTSPSTINQGFRETVSDRGFFKTVGLPLTIARTDANPPANLSGVTTPKNVNTGGVNTIQWAGASATASIIVPFTLPWDYANGITSANKPVHGSLKLGYLLKRTGATGDSDGIYFGCTLNAINPFDATKTAFDGTALATLTKYNSLGVSQNIASVVTGAFYDRYEIDFTEVFGASNAVIKAGAALSFSIAGSTTGTDQFDMTGLYVSYRANAGETARLPYR